MMILLTFVSKRLVDCWSVRFFLKLFVAVLFEAPQSTEAHNSTTSDGRGNFLDNIRQATCAATGNAVATI